MYYMVKWTRAHDTLTHYGEGDDIVRTCMKIQELGDKEPLG